jgi:hypothetical protein
MMFNQKIEERRNAILKCWQRFKEQPPTVLIAEVIERSKTDMPDDFAPWAPGVAIVSDYLLRAAGDGPGSRRPTGWSPGKPDVFTKVVYGNRLMVRGCGEFWTPEREIDMVLAFPFGPLPVFTRTCQAAMRLAEYCHPHPQQGEMSCFPRPREVASGLDWVVATPSGIEWC